MDTEETRQKMAGPIAYPTTPFRKRSQGLGTVDEDTFRKQIRFLIDGGIGVIVPCGGTGEFFSLSLREWQILVEAALQESEGDKVTIMPSVGGGVTQAIEMAQIAERLGCDVVQITFLDPMFGVTEDGIYEYNRRIADSVSIAIMPYRTAAFPMSIELAKRLCEEVRNVAAFKEESGDVEWFREFVLETNGSVATVCGGGEPLAPYYLLAGAKAFTTGIANLVPRLSLELYRAAVAHKWEEVLGIQSMLRPLSTMRSRPGKMIPVIKEGLKMMGLADDAYSRPPIMSLNEQEKKELRRILEDLGVCVTGRGDRPVAPTGSVDRKRRHPQERTMSDFEKAKALIQAFKGDRYVFGVGALAKTGELVARLGQRAVLICGRSAASQKVGQEVKALLSLAGVTVASELQGAGPNAPREDVTRLAGELLAVEPGVIVVIGGGSAIDAAKAAEVLRTLGGVIDDYFGTGRVTKRLAVCRRNRRECGWSCQ